MMFLSPPPIACRITCESMGKVRAAKAFAQERASLDAWNSTENAAAFLKQFPRGVVPHYRIGDYFDHIDFKDEPSERAFIITFHVKQGVDNYWKDALVGITGAIRELGATVKIVSARS